MTQPPNLQPNLQPPLPAQSATTPSLSMLRLATLGGVAALILLGLLWEIWLAPLRPGGSMLFLKVVPLILLLPGLWRSQRRAVQALSLVIQIYLTEGLVRATSDAGLSASLAWLETLLSTVVFAATLLWAKGTRGGSPAADPAEANHASKPR